MSPEASRQSRPPPPPRRPAGTRGAPPCPRRHRDNRAPPPPLAVREDFGREGVNPRRPVLREERQEPRGAELVRSDLRAKVPETLPGIPHLPDDLLPDRPHLLAPPEEFRRGGHEALVREDEDRKSVG